MLSYSQMVVLCKELKDALVPALFLEMKEVEEKKWVLIFAVNSKEFKLLISLQGRLARFHLTKRRTHFKETSFTKDVEGYLQDFILKKAVLLGADRILQLEFNKGSKTLLLIVDFIPRQTNICLISEDGKILLSAEKYDSSNTPSLDFNFFFS